jgi:hypothetical protein
MPVPLVSVVLEQRAQLHQAPLPGGSDGSHRHRQVLRDARVVGALIERDHPQQPLAPLVQSRHREPQDPLLVAEHGGLLRRLGGGQLRLQLLGLGRVGPALRLAHPPRLATGAHREPARHGPRVGDGLVPAHQGQPRRLHDVLGERALQAIGPHHVPQHRRHEPHEGIHRPRLAVLPAHEQARGLLHSDISPDSPDPRSSPPDAAAASAP